MARKVVCECQKQLITKKINDQVHTAAKRISTTTIGALSLMVNDQNVARNGPSASTLTALGMDTE